MALVSSGSVAPSYPRAQNTSSALSSASSTSNCRVRPDGTAISFKKKCRRPLTGIASPVHSFIVPCSTKKSNEEIGMSGITQERPLAGKVAVVTGGSRGIGAAIAKRLAANGASVAVTYSKGADAAAALVQAIFGAGGKAIAILADGADADAVRSAVEKTVATFGRLDVLVNNAGTAIPMNVEETTLADFDRVFAVNVRGTFVATQAALKHLKTGGRIIMIGSCLGERVFMPGAAPYAATKGSVKMFTQGLARELGSRGITVNNVQPGPIDTDLNPASGEWAAGQKAAVPLDRYGHADEVAALVAFVAGPESSYVNGANLTVDGGTNA